MNFYKLLMAVVVVLLLAGCERCVPALYVGPDTLDKREDLLEMCFNNIGYQAEEKKREIIEDCRNLAIETYGVAGFKYQKPTLDYGPYDTSRTQPCSKSKTKAEKHICLN